jgi:hypothetical protein
VENAGVGSVGRFGAGKGGVVDSGDGAGVEVRRAHHNTAMSAKLISRHSVNNCVWPPDEAILALGNNGGGIEPLEMAFPIPLVGVRVRIVVQRLHLMPFSMT